MKIGTIIGICALACASAIGCSGGSAGTGGFGSESGDTSSGSTGSGSSTSGDTSSGSSGTGSGSSTTGTSSGSSSGSNASGGSGSGSSSSGTSAPADGGIIANDGAPQDNAETDYSRTKTVTMDSFSVPAHGEVFYCQTFPNPWGAQVDIKTYSLDMSTGSHHMFAFYQANVTSKGALAQCSGLTYGAFTFTSQSPDLTQTYPVTVGATVPATTGFNMMVHYLNTGSTPISTHVALTMYVAKPNVVTQHAGVIFLNDAGISVKPGVSTTSTSYVLPQAVTILTSDSHMHQQATNFVATAGSTTLYTTNDWNEPVAKTYNPPLQLPAGTNITWSCTYNNMSQTTLTFGESAMTNVMCISVSIFYPVTDVNNPVLGSPISGILGGGVGH